MDTSVKHCIVNAHTGLGWYPKGQQRLERSLIYHGSTADHLFFDSFPKNGYDESCPYNIKASAIERAIELGYRRILWLDCSVWAINNPMRLWDVINDHGYYFWGSGYNCAQVCSDKCLKYFGVDRDSAELMKDCSTSMFGVNMDNPEGERFISSWIRAAKDGVFSGSREHDGQSEDHRFLFHRQDQSAASVILNLMGLRMHEVGVYSAYYNAAVDQSNLVYLMQGI